MRTLPIVIHLNAVHFVEDLNQWCHANGQTMKINRTERITTAAAFWNYYFYHRDEEDWDNGLIDYDYHFINRSLISMPYFNHYVDSLFPLWSMLSHVSPCCHLFICLQSWNHWWWLFIIFKDKKVLFLWRRYYGRI